MKRIAVAGFLHESNTFLGVPTSLSAFRSTSWHEGGALLDRWSGAKHEIGGLLDGCEAAGMKPVPLLATFAVPGGTVEREAFDAIAGRIADLLKQSLPVNGVLLALHGATVSEDYPDADGEVARRVRQIVGPRVPVILTLDLHANISSQMVEHTDAIVCYSSNPHLDQRERGLEAAHLMWRTVSGEIEPVQACVRPPWIIPIDRQYTGEEPARSLYENARKAARLPGLVSASVAMGFYYADVEEMGVSFVAVADRDRGLASSAARQMAQTAWAGRGDFASRLIPVAEAVRNAASAPAIPVALFDVGDNVGAGSPADSTHLLAELYRQHVPDTLAVLYDPQAAAVCAAAGVAAEVNLEAGGKTDERHGLPLSVRGHVRALTDGRFIENAVRHGGWGGGDQGLTAAVESEGGRSLILTSRRMAPMSLHQVLSTGCRPDLKRALVVKGVVAPRAAYEPVSAEILLVNTPGSTAGDPSLFEYRRRRRPLYPLEPVEWGPDSPTVDRK